MAVPRHDTNKPHKTEILVRKPGSAAHYDSLNSATTRQRTQILQSPPMNSLVWRQEPAQGLTNRMLDRQVTSSNRVRDTESINSTKRQTKAHHGVGSGHRRLLEEIQPGIVRCFFRENLKVLVDDCDSHKNTGARADSTQEVSHHC